MGMKKKEISKKWKILNKNQKNKNGAYSAQLLS